MSGSNDRISYDADNIDKNAVGERIKKIRNQLGLKQSEIAKELNVGTTSVTNWEKGNNLPNTNRLEALAEIGNVSVDYLLYGKILTPKEFFEKNLSNYIYNESFILRYSIQSVTLPAIKDMLMDIANIADDFDLEDTRLINQKNFEQYYQKQHLTWQTWEARFNKILPIILNKDDPWSILDFVVNSIDNEILSLLKIIKPRVENPNHINVAEDVLNDTKSNLYRSLIDTAEN